VKGSYSLIIKTPEKAEIGALGQQKFNKKYAVYNGSAFGSGGLKRVLRHFSTGKKIHWHIDYLLKTGHLKYAFIFPEKDLECRLTNKISGNPIEGFGCSDCKCSSHLFEYNDFSKILEELTVFPGVKVMDQDRYKQYSEVEAEKTIKDLIRDLPDANTYKHSSNI